MSNLPNDVEDPRADAAAKAVLLKTDWDILRKSFAAQGAALKAGVFLLQVGRQCFEVKIHTFEPLTFSTSRVKYVEMGRAWCGISSVRKDRDRRCGGGDVRGAQAGNDEGHQNPTSL